MVAVILTNFDHFVDNITLFQLIIGDCAES